jgi:hypothetical protein
LATACGEAMKAGLDMGDIGVDAVDLADHLRDRN